MIVCEIFKVSECICTIIVTGLLRVLHVKTCDTSSRVLREPRVKGRNSSNGGLGVSDTLKSSSLIPSSDMARELMSANCSNTVSGRMPSWMDSSVSWLARETRVSVLSSWTSVRIGSVLIFCRALRTDSKVRCCMEERLSSSSIVFTLLTAHSWEWGSSRPSTPTSPGVVLRTTWPWAGVILGVSQASLWPDSGVWMKSCWEWTDSWLPTSEISWIGMVYWSCACVFRPLPPESGKRGDPTGVRIPECWGKNTSQVSRQFWKKKS